MNRLQRVALVAGLLVVGWQLFAVTTPFGDNCSAAALEAFRAERSPGLDKYLPPENASSSDDVLRRFGAAAGGSPCRDPARDRLWRSGVVAVLASVGTAAAVRILADSPRPTREEE